MARRQLTITLNLDEPNFKADPGLEAARILRALASRLLVSRDVLESRTPGHIGFLHDANRRPVGEARLNIRYNRKPKNSGSTTAVRTATAAPGAPKAPGLAQTAPKTPKPALTGQKAHS